MPAETKSPTESLLKHIADCLEVCFDEGDVTAVKRDRIATDGLIIHTVDGASFKITADKIT